MNPRELRVGDRVAEHSSPEGKRFGRVVHTYALEGETRYVVKFDDRSESVFFGYELSIVDDDKPAEQST